MNKTIKAIVFSVLTACGILYGTFAYSGDNAGGASNLLKEEKVKLTKTNSSKILFYQGNTYSQFLENEPIDRDKIKRFVRLDPRQKTGVEMARLYNVSEPTVSRVVAEHRKINI